MNWDEGCVSNGVATIGGIVCVIRAILNIAAPLMAIVALGMVLFAGAKMIAGGDNPKEIAAAQQTLLWAVIGLIGLALAWVILVVISRLTGADLFNLAFPSP